METARGHLTLHSIPSHSSHKKQPSHPFLWQPALAPPCPLLQPHKFCLVKNPCLAGDHGGGTDSLPASPHGSGAVTDMKKQPLRGQHHVFLCWTPFTLFLSKSSQAQVCPGVQAEAPTAWKVSLQAEALPGSISKQGKGQTMTGQL